MKQFLCVLLLLFLCGPAFGDSATLQWDQNDPVPDGYRLYQRVVGEEYDYGAPIYEGSALSFFVDNLVDGTTYTWVVRAFVGDVDSADSNEVIYTAEVQAPALVIPGRPKSLTILFE